MVTNKGGNPMISKEEYAALREQIIAELKEEKRARDQARIKLNEAVATMFDETARTYLPKLMTEFYEDLRKKYPTDNETGIASRCKGIVESSVSVVIELLCERNEMTLYKNGRAEEANKLLAQLLEEKIERHRKNAKQQ
jgi:hypothetical protein